METSHEASAGRKIWEGNGIEGKKKGKKKSIPKFDKNEFQGLLCTQSSQTDYLKLAHT